MEGTPSETTYPRSANFWEQGYANYVALSGYNYMICATTYGRTRHVTTHDGDCQTRNKKGGAMQT
jgi:hypothetical protein